jgi:WD40 repeat protein
MSTIDDSRELAAALDRLVPVDAVHGDWNDVVGRVERRAVGTGVSRRPRRSVRVTIALVVLALLLAGVATAAYLILRGPGQLTLIGGGRRVASVVGLDPRGKPRVLWRCPHDVFCGDLVSAAWSPDGRRLALSVDTIAAVSLYDGVHIVDVAAGTDRQLPKPPPQPATSAGRLKANVELFRAQQRLFGCAPPRDFAWSPDGSRLAYSCGRSAIYVIRPDGTGRTRVRTRTPGARWPSWSPNGRRLVFSSGELPSRSAIYTIDLDGSHKRLVARGSAPDWSPDGSTIAYRAPSCVPGGRPSLFGSIRLVTPAGRDVTPARLDRACERLGPFEWPVPAWAPDGRRLAIGTGSGLYLVDRDGSGLREIAAQAGGGLYGQARPAWQPAPRGGTR